MLHELSYGKGRSRVNFHLDLVSKITTREAWGNEISRKTHWVVYVRAVRCSKSRHPLPPPLPLGISETGSDLNLRKLTSGMTPIQGINCSLSRPSFSFGYSSQL